MVAEVTESAPSWHISVARCGEGEYAAPAMPGGLVEVQVTNGETAAAILLTPAAARLLAADLLRIAASAEARGRGGRDAVAAD